MIRMPGTPRKKSVYATARNRSGRNTGPRQAAHHGQQQGERQDEQLRDQEEPDVLRERVDLARHGRGEDLRR